MTGKVLHLHWLIDILELLVCVLRVSSLIHLHLHIVAESFLLEFDVALLAVDVLAAHLDSCHQALYGCFKIDSLDGLEPLFKFIKISRVVVNGNLKLTNIVIIDC